MATTAMKSCNDIAYPRTGKRGVPQQFPRRLYKMLQSESPDVGRSSSDGDGDQTTKDFIISWSESGRAFRIADANSFSSLVLPKYFRTSKFSSFQRNLNLYGFSKVRRGPDTDMYAHPAFLRGHPELLSQLKKSTNSAGKNRSCSSSSAARPSSSAYNGSGTKLREKINSQQQLGHEQEQDHDTTHLNTPTSSPSKVLSSSVGTRLVSPTSSQEELHKTLYISNHNSSNQVPVLYNQEPQVQSQMQSHTQQSSAITTRFPTFSSQISSSHSNAGFIPFSRNSARQTSSPTMSTTSSTSSESTTSRTKSHGKLDLLTIAMTCLAEREIVGAQTKPSESGFLVHN